MADLGQAYVQIVPTAKGISGQIANILGDGAGAGGKFGAGMIGGIKKAFGAAALGAVVTKALTEGAKLEQSLGGIETLFKESANIVIKNSETAYKRAGVSANDYMENITSFSASLLQSTGGDTVEAAKIADMAMVDMSDNANKFGTDIASIQRAYQGFARGQYGMLDNLKLGYGGTKAEMERLLADAEKISGIHYDMSNLDDVYQAIHVIQQELGVTGTTAEEASTTLSGSFGAMKASMQDLFGQLMIGQNVSGAVTAVLETTLQFAYNVGKAVVNVLMNIPQAVVTLLSNIGQMLLSNGPMIYQKATQLVNQIAMGIQFGIPALLEKATFLVQTFGVWLQLNFPTILQKGVELVSKLVNGILEGLPNLIESAGNLILAIVDVLIQNLPTIAQAGVQLVANLAKSLVQNAPKIIVSIGRVMANLVKTIIKNIPNILKAGVEIVIGLVKGLVSAGGSVLSAIGDIVRGAIDTFLSGEWMSSGSSVIDKIASGIAGVASTILTALGNLAKNAIDKFKNGSWASAGKDAINKIKNALTSAGGAIKDALGGLADKAINFFKGKGWAASGKDAGQKTADGLRSKGGAAQSAGAHVGSSGVSGVASQNRGAINAGSGLGFGAAGGIGGAVRAAADAGSSVGSGGVGGIRSGGAGSPSVGAEITNGTARGINASHAIANLIGQAVNMARAALNAAKNFLQIHSPSRVFRDEVGMPIPEGTAVGIEKYSYYVTDAVKDMTDEAIKTAQSESGRFQDVMSNQYSLNASVDHNGGPAGTRSEVVSLLQAILEKDNSIYMDGEKVGDTLSPILNKKLGEVY